MIEGFRDAPDALLDLYISGTKLAQEHFLEQYEWDLPAIFLYPVERNPRRY